MKILQFDIGTSPRICSFDRRLFNKDGPMPTLTKPIDCMTIDELQLMAATKFAEAAALPLGERKQGLLTLAHMVRALAELKKVVIHSTSALN
jgi:hypothetical protein